VARASGDPRGEVKTLVLLVQDFMRRGALTLSPDASVFDALRLSHDRRIRHVPILEDDRLVGIISDRDIRDMSPPLGDSHRVSTMKENRVGDVMTPKVVTTHPQDTAMPVVAEEDLVGIITTSDVMRALVTFPGGLEPGVPQIAGLARKPGVLAEVADITSGSRGWTCSVSSLPRKRYRLTIVP
jgi:acetoin utilization protein AcuB